MTFKRYWICENSASPEQKAAQGLFFLAAGLRDGYIKIGEVEDKMREVLDAVDESEAERG